MDYHGTSAPDNKELAALIGREKRERSKTYKEISDNSHNFRDRLELEAVPPADPMGPTVTERDIMEKYADLVVND